MYGRHKWGLQPMRVVDVTWKSKCVCLRAAPLFCRCSFLLSVVVQPTRPDYPLVRSIPHRGKQVNERVKRGRYVLFVIRIEPITCSWHQKWVNASGILIDAILQYILHWVHIQEMLPSKVLFCTAHLSYWRRSVIHRRRASVPNPLSERA